MIKAALGWQESSDVTFSPFYSVSSVKIWYSCTICLYTVRTWTLFHSSKTLAIVTSATHLLLCTKHCLTALRLATHMSKSYDKELLTYKLHSTHVVGLSMCTKPQGSEATLYNAQNEKCLLKENMIILAPTKM